MKFLGYVYDVFGHQDGPQTLSDEAALLAFINDNGDAPQMVITDLAGRQLLLTREGIDLFNALASLGIELGETYLQTRREAVGAFEGNTPKPEWEEFYDSIGVLPGEIRMRQRVKRDCLAAETVADVAALLRGTYFSVYFYNPEREKCWGHFDEATGIAEALLLDGDGYWHDTGSQVRIPTESRVSHWRSGENIHEFILFDPPVERDGLS